jgi:hypothetical protein
MNISIKKLTDAAYENTCFISNEIFETLKLSKETMYELHLGHLSELVFINSYESSDASIYLNDSTFNKLIPFGDLKLNIWRTNKDIYLGPVIGVLETPRTLLRLLQNKDCFYETQHIKASILEGCLCYYFSNENINFEEETVEGITFSPALNKWQSFLFPLPNVVYDVGIFLTDELKPIGKKIRGELRNLPSIKFINNKNGLGKWELYEKLSKYKNIKHYLPETIIYTKKDDIRLMISKYNLIFLKSFHGSKGEEVLSIEQLDNGIKLNYYDGYEEKLKELVLNNIEELDSIIDEFFGEEDFVIQQGIRLLKYEGCKFDLRILLQKNEKGIWQSSYIQCRIAKKNINITNTSAGGMSLIYEKAYPILCNSNYIDSVPDSTKLTEAAFKIAGYIEREFGLFGELGMDIAIDTSGNIWLLEANAKSDKDIDETYCDLYGNKFVDSIIEIKQKQDINYSIHYFNSELVYPQASYPFKYAKFISKCK